MGLDIRFHVKMMSLPPSLGCPLLKHLCCTCSIFSCQSTFCLIILEHWANLSVNGCLSLCMLPCDEIATWPGCTILLVQLWSYENIAYLFKRLGNSQRGYPLEACLDSGTDLLNILVYPRLLSDLVKIVVFKATSEPASVSRALS